MGEADLDANGFFHIVRGRQKGQIAFCRGPSSAPLPLPPLPPPLLLLLPLPPPPPVPPVPVLLAATAGSCTAAAGSCPAAAGSCTAASQPRWAGWCRPSGRPAVWRVPRGHPAPGSRSTSGWEAARETWCQVVEACRPWPTRTSHSSPAGGLAHCCLPSVPPLPEPPPRLAAPCRCLSFVPPLPEPSPRLARLVGWPGPPAPPPSHCHHHPPCHGYRQVPPLVHRQTWQLRCYCQLACSRRHRPCVHALPRRSQPPASAGGGTRPGDPAPAGRVQVNHCLIK